VNILAVIVLILLILILFFSIIGFLTRHNKYESVPSVIGQQYDQAVQALEAKGFDVEIQDSVYIDTAAKYSVIKQSPEPDAVVKANRTVYLTVNRTVAPLTTVPNMVGFSFRSAELMLQSLSLKLGDTSYRPDIARNSVLEMRYEGKPIVAGTRIPMGSSVGFVLGSGKGTEERPVPDIIGMTLGEARAYLSSFQVSIGSIVPPALAGNENAYITRTDPPRYSEPTPGQRVLNRIRPGEIMTVWVSPSKPVVIDTGTSPPPPPPEEN
jgi:beta-lactam-binding protein with PASTA domain